MPRTLVAMLLGWLVGCTALTGAGDLEVSAITGGGGSDASPIDGGNEAEDDGSLPPTPPASCDEPDLVARWLFDDGSGSAVRDCTTGGHDGLAIGDPPWVDGRTGRALFLVDGDRVDFGDPAELRIGGPFTIAVWTWLQRGGNGSQYLLGRRSDATGDGWRLSRELDKFGFLVNGDGFETVIDSTPATFAVERWIHVAGVFRPGVALEIYVDGVPDGTRTVEVPNVVNHADGVKLLAGARGDLGNGLSGTLDDIRFYRRALSATEIAAIAAP